MPEIPFNNARGMASSLQMTPPFAFSDVTISVFPLRASLPTLDNFCRNYLNQAPHLVQFRPFVPFVYLVILDYGRMSLEAANMGWVSQREVAFGIPLRWLNTGENGPEFYDWAFTSPFIFVDNELSMSTGREVYGWPKLLARLDPSVSEWVANPHGSRRVFQVSTKGAKEAYAGETNDYQTLLSVHQHRTAGILDIPPNLDSVVKPLTQMSGALTSMTRLSVDLTKTFLGMASDRITGTAVLPDMLDQENFRAQLEKDRLSDWWDMKEWAPGIKDTLWSMFPRLYANTINFKQFRDAANPRVTCYQAITAARMPVKSFKEGGLLGPQNMMLGQLDGGFSIDVHRIAGLPIVESLGLEVSGEREVDGSVVYSLSPICPLWMKVDMTYGLADTVVWRGRESTAKGGWKEGDALKEARAQMAERHKSDAPGDPPAPVTPEEKPEQRTAQSYAKTQVETEAADDSQTFDYIRAMNFFNTTRGGSEAVGGAFNLPDASVRVLPLKANSATLQKFVRNYLRVDDKMRFEAWGDYVYLVISDFKQVNSELSAIAKRRAREMSLLVPVKCYDWYDDDKYVESGSPKKVKSDEVVRAVRGEEKLLTTGFVNAFTYVDDVATAITANEVFGVPSMGSRIESCANDWLSHDFSGETENQNLLEMHAQVLPELMAGAQAVDRTLVELADQSHHRSNVQESKAETVGRWVGVIADDLECKLHEDSKIVSDNDWHDYEQISHRQEAVRCAQGFALKLLGGDMALNQFALKQFRDSRDSEAACYQGLILRRHHLKKLKDFREIEEPLTVSITDYPTQPICQILGLIPKYSYPGTDKIVRVFEAIRPFSINADIHRGSGVTLFERAGRRKKWKQVDLTPQVFGWREVDRHDIQRVVNTAAAPMDLAYQRKIEGGLPWPERIQMGHSRQHMQWWFRDRVQTNQVGRVLIRNRKHLGGVSVLADRNSLKQLDDSVNKDIGAWNQQMTGQETQFRQCDVARGIELYSPATILDKVLSSEWGKADERRPMILRKPDFCMPVSTVPSATAAHLFPEIERLGNHWPLSFQFFKDMAKQRRDEIVAFKSELRHAASMIAIFYPAARMEATKTETDPSWTIETALTWLSKQLTDLMDGTPKERLRRAFKKIVDGAAAFSSDEEMMAAVEEIFMEFIDIHLPDSFKMKAPQGPKPKLLQRLPELFEVPTITDIPAEDWGDLVTGLRDIVDKLHIDEDVLDTLKKDLKTDINFKGILNPVIQRAEANYIEMQKIGALMEEANALSEQGIGADQFPLDDPHILLRKRLKDYMTSAERPQAARNKATNGA